MPTQRAMPAREASVTCGASLCACDGGDEPRIGPFDGPWMRGDLDSAQAVSERLGQAPNEHGVSRFQSLLRELHSAYINEMEILESEISSLRERLTEPPRDNVLKQTKVLEGTVAMRPKTENEPAPAERDLRSDDITFDDTVEFETGGFGCASEDTLNLDHKRLQALPGGHLERDMCMRSGRRDPSTHAHKSKRSTHRNSGVKDMIVNVRRSETDNERRSRMKRSGLSFLTIDADDEDGCSLRRVVRSKGFELSISFLIIVYAFVMCIEAEYQGYRISLDMPPEALDEEFTFYVCHMVFGIFFTIEMLLKLVTLRMLYFFDYWNWIDGTLVILWLVSTLGEILIPISPSVMRIARLARVMRLLSLIKRVQGADTLFVISTAIRHSVIVFFWTCVLLSVTLALCALLTHQYMCEFYFPKTNLDPGVFEMFYWHFGTFTRAFFTMFELTLANGPPIIRMLALHVSEWCFLIGVLHKLSVGFAIIGIINGVFMQEVFSVASSDDMLMLRRKERAQNMHYNKMKALMGGTSLRIEGWRRLVNDPQVKLWLSSMEFDAGDPDCVFHLLDESHDGEIELDELVKGVARLKGTARSIDVFEILSELRALKKMMRASVASEFSRTRSSEAHEGVVAHKGSG